MRIASLLPSATEIVCALGLQDDLVAVTHECDFPPAARGRPVVTRSTLPAAATSAEIDRMVSRQRSGGRPLYELDVDRLSALRPDLIVTQTLCDVCAVDDRDVRRFLDAISGPVAPRVLYLEPTRLEDVFANIIEVADAAGVPRRGRELVVTLKERILAVQRESHRRRASAAEAKKSHPAEGAPPKVVVLEWLDPPFTCGHWTPELVRLAGAVEPLAVPGQRSRRVEIDALAQSDPDALLIACCGFAIERTLADVPGFLAQPQVSAMRCVRAGHVFVTDGSAYFSRPGPRLVDALEILAVALALEGAPGSRGEAAPRGDGRRLIQALRP